MESAPYTLRMKRKWSSQESERGQRTQHMEWPAETLTKDCRAHRKEVAAPPRDTRRPRRELKIMLLVMR